MHVTAVELVDFRSYPAVSVALPAGVTTFVGANGQGKTNLVEALGYLATLSSHRVASDVPLVREGAERAVIRATVERDDRQLLLEVEINPGRANRARVNRAPLARTRELVGILRIVVFAPEDLALVRGEPEGRRRMLDELVVQRAPRLSGVQADYERVLRQRNALLKSAGGRGGRARSASGPDLGVLDAWDAHLVRSGAEVMASRVAVLQDLTPRVSKAYDALVDADTAVTLSYRSSVTQHKAATQIADEDLAEELPTTRDAWAERFLRALTEAREAELERGLTLVGPHRDDVTLSLGGMPVKGYASHGESWSMALSLRLAAYELLRAEGGDPVLVLDDVFAELDDVRRRRLAASVSDAEQVLVTAAVLADVPEVLSGARFAVADGQVRALDE